VTPPDTSSSPSPTTTYTYDADGNLATQTAPNGDVPNASAGSNTTTYGYDDANELTSVTNPLGGVTSYSYDGVGNQTSVTDPNGNKTQYAYNLDNQQTQVTDAAGNTTKTAYDLDGNIVSTTDQNGNSTLYTLDADGEVTQAQVPAQAPGASVSYDTTQYVYDQDGNQTEVISPRGVASGISGAYTTQTKYNGDGQVSAVLTPYNPQDSAPYNTPAQTSYSYDADGRLSSVTAPPSNASAQQPNVTDYQYYDNGWVQSETDPTGITTSYDYNPLGEQSSRVILSAGGAMSRTQTWGYYPDGKLYTVSDQGVPTGLYAEVVDDSDVNNASASPPANWSTAQCTSTTVGCEGFEYQTHAAGAGNDTFTWQLNVPQDGNYTVYVKYPVVSGAATNAAFTVSYSGGTATVNVDQTQDNNGGWVSLGKWAFKQDATGQQVSLAENSGGTVVADAVEIVRDNSGDTNTANHNYAYAYDADGNQIGITDSSDQGNNNPATTVTSYSMAYDQLDRNTSVVEDNSSGTAVNTTTYGYDADSSLTSQTHNNAPSSYTYNNLNRLVKESDATSSSDSNPQVTTFTYTPTGQVASEVKPNGNTVNSTYDANWQLNTQTEDTSGGTLVSSNAYTYDPDGNETQDVEQLMSADNSADTLSHTYTYTYDPMDQVETVDTDGVQTESYTHDSESEVTSQTVNQVTTNYNYVQGQLQSATALPTGGGSSTTLNYNYDPFGRLDTVTTPPAGGSTTPTLVQSNTYDGFDNLTATSQLGSTGTMDTTDYTYDSLNRMTSQTTQANTPSAATSNFSYLGLSGELVSEQDPAESKTYDYTPSGTRLSQTITNGGTSSPGYYTYNSHQDVEAVTGSSGETTATYGYTAYGQPIQSMFTGADENNATSSPANSTTPYNSYRFNAMRWDSSTGVYDMG
jgi:YD repeat-containing protein